MALKLEDWGKIIIQHYKNNPDSFYISLQDIVDGAKSYDPQIIENISKSIKEGRNKNTLEESITRLFAKSLCPVTQSLTALEIAQALKNIWRGNTRGADLCVMALLICACEHHTEGIRQNNYYERLKNFLKSSYVGYHLVPDIYFSTPFFSNHSGLGLSDLCLKVSSTWSKEGIPLSLRISKDQNGRNQYTETIMSLCLINGTLIERFKHIFGSSGFTPIYNPSDEELISAFKNHHSEIGISEEDSKVLLADKETLIQALRKAFDSWDGTTTSMVKGERKGTRLTETDSTIESLTLSLESKPGEDTLELQAFLYSTAQLESNIRQYVADNGQRFKARICNGKSRNSLKNDTTTVGEMVVTSLLSSMPFSLKDVDNDCKAVFRPKDLYLFKQCFGLWEEAVYPSLGKPYLLLLKNSRKNDLNDLLGDTKILPFKGAASPVEGYSLYETKELKKIPGNRIIPRPHFLEIYIDNFVYGPNIKTVVRNDNQFIVKIDGDLNTDVPVYVTSTDGKKRIPLEFQKGEWMLDFSKIRFDAFDKDKNWNLYVDSKKALDYEFKFGDFSLPEEMRGMALTLDGEIDPQGTVKGLELSKEQLQQGYIVEATKMSISSSNAPLPENSDTKGIQTPTEFLLQALTSLSYDFFSLKEAEAATAIFAPELLDNLENTLKKWFALGYLNIGSDSSSRKFVVNAPTLVLLTPDYAPINVEGVEGSAAIHFTGLITGGRDPQLIKRILDFRNQNPNLISVEILYPDPTLPPSIFVHSKQIGLLEELARTSGLLYYPRIYAPAMFKGLPSISKYEEAARHNAAAYSGEALTYDIDSIVQDFHTSNLKNAASYKKNQKGGNGLNIFSLYGRKIGVMVQEDGEAYHVGRNWGLWIEAKNKGKQLVREGINELIVPGVTPLPSIFQRALCLITGRLPHFDPSTKTNRYHLASNPTETGQYVTAQGIMNKLN